MLYHDEILFDLIRGEEPTAIYGDILLDDDEANLNLTHMKKVADHRFREMFLQGRDELSIMILEKTLEKMWNEGWNPEKGNINLFATGFGTILTSLMVN